MLYLGIDQSYGGFGLARLYTAYADISVVRFSSRKFGRGVDRLIAVEDWLWEQLDLLPEWPQHVAMEGYARGRQNRREEAGELAAIVKRVLWSALPDLVHYPTIVAPSQVKYFATGKGSATKEDVIAAVRQKWGVTCKNDNAADAFTLAKIAQAVATGQTDYDYEREVIERLTPHTERVAYL